MIASDQHVAKSGSSDGGCGGHDNKKESQL